MVSKKALNKENLLKLGTDQLADLLLEISHKDTIVKRMLKIAIAGSLGSEAASKEIRKRINTISRSRSHIDWDKKKPLLQDLEAQYTQILKQVFPENMPEALDLMWCLLRLANGIFERIYSDNGEITDFFHKVCKEIGRISHLSQEKPHFIVNALMEALFENHHEQSTPLFSDLSEALGEKGITLLKEKLLEKQSQKGMSFYDKEKITYVLQEIADLQEDVDGFIKLIRQEELFHPYASEAVSSRLLRVGRIQEAWEYSEKTKIDLDDMGYYTKWVQTRLEIMEALGKKQEAQNFRYAIFEKTLHPFLLKDYLGNIEEDAVFPVEQKALHFVMKNETLHQAIDFFIAWNAPYYLSEMILKRSSEMNGNDYYALPEAATFLASSHFLAATLCFRAMIDHTLEYAKAKRYKYCAKYLKECKRLSHNIKDYQSHPSHAVYYENLYEKHHRKASFWSLL